MTDRAGFLTIVMPVLNEQEHVEQALSSLVVQLQERPAEILVMDGGSSDATRSIVGRLALIYPMITLVDNPARLQSAACNLAAELMDARSKILMRADAHASYPDGFIDHVVVSLESSGATSVVVPMRTVGKQFLQRAIAATQNSWLGNGGSHHRRRVHSQFVDHGHHAAFDAAFFRSVGGYDPTFSHNEDAEFDIRARASGGRAWLCAEAAIDYFPRTTLRQLSRQYRRHGRGRSRTVIKHHVLPKLRQLAPLVLLGSFALNVMTPLLPLCALPSGVYTVCCLTWGAATALRRRDPALLLIGPASMTMHLSWAVGFLETQVARLRWSALDRFAMAESAATTFPALKAPHLKV
jgi:succinoglycan biosynthesis protein ExoA